MAILDVLARPLLGFGLVLLFVCLWGRPALADTYKWVDKDGGIHFTDNPDELPEPQRSKVLEELERQRKAREKEQGKKPATKTEYEPIPPEARKERLPTTSNTIPNHSNVQTGGQEFTTKGNKDTSPAPSSRSNKVDPSSKSQRKAWVEKASQARARVSELKKKCNKLRQIRDESSRKSLIFATPKDRQAKASSAEELKTCEQSLEKAKQYLEEGLPEEARRAGVPPGWIR